MTLNISENSWAKSGLAFVLLIALAGLWAYLSGAIFLMAFNKDYNNATLLTFYQYWYHFRANPAVQSWLYLSGGIALACVLSPLLVFLIPSKKSLFGDARFAKTREIRKSGLFGEKGLIVGKYAGKYLTFDGQQHVIMSAPTRSGKGVGVVIPNLLNWPDSVVVLDIKQENWNLTSGYRQKYGQECFLFNPAATDYRTHRYNPLSYINTDQNFRIDDVQKIANMLFPDQPGTDVIWTATPRSFFLGVVLYLLETPGKPVTLGQVLRESLANGDGSAYFTNIINDRAQTANPLSAVCVRALNSYISISSEKTRAGVITSFRSRLELWINPLVDAATSANDFDLRDIRKKRMSIYLGVTPDNLERLAPLMNLLFQQLIDVNTRELPNQNAALKYPCLLLMDEFTAIGKIGILSKGISYIAGYGLRMMPIIQSPSQLFEVYGREAAQTFTTNHALQIVFPPKASETHTAKDISEWLGYQTVKGVSESKGKELFSKRHKSENISDQRRALLLPQEITGLGQHRELVILENLPPILANKIVYYKSHDFMDRLKEVSESLNALGKKLPTQQELDEAIFTGELASSVPRIDPKEHQRRMEAGQPPITIAIPSPTVTEVIKLTRDARADDVPILQTRALQAFDINFTPIPIPKPGDLDQAGLNTYAKGLATQAGVTV